MSFPDRVPLDKAIRKMERERFRSCHLLRVIIERKNKLNGKPTRYECWGVFRDERFIGYLRERKHGTLTYMAGGESFVNLAS